jgi:hypothetical protein
VRRVICNSHNGQPASPHWKVGPGNGYADIIQVLTSRVENMNRQKKLQQLFKAKAKKASAKLAPKKPKYISKADRLKLAAEAGDASINSPSEN